MKGAGQGEKYGEMRGTSVKVTDSGPRTNMSYCAETRLLNRRIPRPDVWVLANSPLARSLYDTLGEPPPPPLPLLPEDARLGLRSAAAAANALRAAS